MEKANPTILTESITIDEFKKIFGFRSDNTVHSLIKKIKVNIVKDGGTSFLDLKAIKKAIRIKELPEKFLSLEEVSILLDINQNKVMSLVKLGFIPYYKYSGSRGAKYLFVEKEIIEARNKLFEADVKLTSNILYSVTIRKYLDYQIFFKDLLTELKLSGDFFSQKEILVFSGLWFGNESLENLAKELNLGNERVRQIFEKSKRKLFFGMKQMGRYFVQNNTHRSQVELLTKQNSDHMFSISKLLSVISDLQEKIVERNPNYLPPTDLEIIKTKLLKMPVTDLDIGVRAQNALRSAEIFTVGDILDKEKNDLCGLRSVGIKTIREINDAIVGLGLDWKVRR